MIINDETIQNMKASLESRGYDVEDITANDKYVRAKCTTRFGQMVIVEIPISMFN